MYLYEYEIAWFKHGVVLAQFIVHVRQHLNQVFGSMRID
jgi:hypothetical protein